MTSKEALKRIETAFSFNREGKESVYKAYTNSIYPYYEDFDLVMKDLEVLEILKDKVYLKEDYDIAWVKASGLVFKDSDEYKLLKEWSDNDE